MVDTKHSLNFVVVSHSHKFHPRTVHRRILGGLLEGRVFILITHNFVYGLFVRSMSSSILSYKVSFQLSAFHLPLFVTLIPVLGQFEIKSQQISKLNNHDKSNSHVIIEISKMV